MRQINKTAKTLKNRLILYHAYKSLSLSEREKEREKNWNHVWNIAGKLFSESKRMENMKIKHWRSMIKVTQIGYRDNFLRVINTKFRYYNGVGSYGDIYLTFIQFHWIFEALEIEDHLLEILWSKKNKADIDCSLRVLFFFYSILERKKSATII